MPAEPGPSCRAAGPVGTSPIRQGAGKGEGRVLGSLRCCREGVGACYCKLQSEAFGVKESLGLNSPFPLLFLKIH